MADIIQYKFLLDNTESFEESAKLKGIAFGEESSHVYIYFQIPKDEKLSNPLRIKISDKNIATDLKIRDLETGEYKHFEVGIEDSKKLTEIYENIGCKKIVEFHKVRKTYQVDYVRLDLDTVQELGSFLEVKFSKENKDKVEDLLKKLNIDITKYDKRSNVNIYLEKINN